MVDRDYYERLEVDDSQQILLDAVTEGIDHNQLKKALRNFLVDANITLEDDALVDKLATLVVNRPSPEARLEFTRFIIRQYTYSGLQELLKLIAIAGLTRLSYYVARLFGQLGIEAAIVLGEQTGYTLLRDNERLHTILGQCSVIASTAVYIRFGYATTIAEYKALKRFIGTKEVNWKNLVMRVMAIVPSACMSIIAYARNSLFYTLSLGGFLYCLLAPSMAGLNQMRLGEKAMGLLIGSPTMSHFITPFTLKPKDEGVAITLHYFFGIGAVLTFPQFARLGTMELIAQVKQDAKHIADSWGDGSTLKNTGLSLMYTAKWLLNTTIGTLSGLPTAMMGYLLLKHYDLDDNPSVVVAVMSFCVLTGNQCNQPSLNHLVGNCKYYLSHLLWEAPKNLATLPQNCRDLWASFRGNPNPDTEALTRIETQAGTHDEEAALLTSGAPFSSIQ